MAARQPRAGRAHIDANGQRLVIRIPPWFDGPTLVGAVVCGVSFAAVVFGLWQGLSPEAHGLHGPFQVAWVVTVGGLFALYILFALVSLLFGTERIEVTSDGLVVRALFCLPARKLARGAIRDLRLYPTGRRDVLVRGGMGQIECDYEGCEVRFVRCVDALEARTLLELIAERLGDDVLAPGMTCRQPRSEMAGSTAPLVIGAPPLDRAPRGVQVAERGEELIIRLPPRRGCVWFVGAALFLLVLAGFLGLWPCVLWFLGRAALRGTVPAPGIVLISIMGLLWVAVVPWLVPRAFPLFCRGLEVRVRGDRLSTRIDPMSLEIAYAASEIRNLRLAEPAPPGWAGPEDKGWIVLEYCGQTERICRDVGEAQARYVFEAIVSRLGHARDGATPERS
jgi:hypothetical protein